MLATCKFTIEARLLTEAAICIYRLYIQKNDSIFFVGVVFCDVTMLAEEGALPRVLQYLSPSRKYIWWIPFFLGVYLSAFSHGFAGDLKDFSGYPGWTIIHLLVPRGDFKFWFRFWGSALIVPSIPQLPVCMRILESRIVEFLGRVSFAFYLIHGPLLWSIGVRMYAACGLSNRYPQLQAWDSVATLPDWGLFGLEIRWLVPMLGMLTLTLGVSEIFTRIVDEPSIKLVHWIFSRGSEIPQKRTLPLHEDGAGEMVQLEQYRDIQGPAGSNAELVVEDRPRLEGDTIFMFSDDEEATRPMQERQ